MYTPGELQSLHTLIVKALLRVYKIDPAGRYNELDPVADFLDAASHAVSSLYYKLHKPDPDDQSELPF